MGGIEMHSEKFKQTQISCVAVQREIPLQNRTAYPVKCNIPICIYTNYQHTNNNMCFEIGLLT